MTNATETREQLLRQIEMLQAQLKLLEAEPTDNSGGSRHGNAEGISEQDTPVTNHLKHVTNRVRAEQDSQAARAAMRVAEESHMASEARFRALEREKALRRTQYCTDNCSTPIAWILPNGKVYYVNQAVAISLGYSRDELYSMSVSDVDPDWPAGGWPAEWERFKKAGCTTFESRHRHKDGSIFPVLITANHVNFDGEEFLFAFVNDITDRKRKEQQIRDSEERFRAIFNSTFQFIGLMGTDGTLLEANETALAFGDLKSEDVLGKPLWETPWWRGDEARVEQLRDAVARAAIGKTVRYTVEVQGADSVETIDFTLKPITDADGNVRMIIPEGRVITEQKRAERALRASEAALRKLNVEWEQRVGDRTAELSEAIATIEESERRLSAILNNTSFLIGLCNADGLLLLANRAVCTALGHPESAWVGRPLWEGPAWPTDEVRAEVREAINVAASGQFCRAEVLHVLADGSTAIFDFSISPIHDAGGNVVMLVPEGRDISELKRIEQELREAKERAEAADRVKSAFLATMSHELRTPLNSIIGFTGIMLQGIVGDLSEEQLKQLRMVEKSADHLLSLINDVLDISKIEAGQFEIHTRPFDVRDAVKRSLEMIAPPAEAKGLPLRVEICADVAAINSDRRRFEQVLINLLNNAVKFTEEGSVELRCDVRDGHLFVRVIDTGVGISAEDQPKLFQPFQQLDTGIDRRHQGSGLGLAIASRLVALMKGEISVDSEVGKGSTFEFSLPLDASP